MLFSSLVFIYVFLPILILLYFTVARNNRTIQCIILTLFSLIFYAFGGEPIYVLLMIGIVLVNYVFGFLCATDGMSEPTVSKKIFLAADIVINLGTLGFFKYTNFFIKNFNAAAGTSIPALNVLMPIGISFFTFQAMSYVIDTYRGVTRCQKNFLKLLMYVSFFPQLIAGPIVRYQDIEDQLDNRTVTAEKINDGILRFGVGVAKKIIIADGCFAAAESLFSVSSGTYVLGYWIGALFYTLQIYFDFSGYSDMAIGLGKIFGFDFPENFNYPYASKNATEFWRRWHISLGTWFKDYLFYPLLKTKGMRTLTKKLSKSGHKKASKTIPTVLSLFVVWFATGFWHGANWNFIIWGLYYFVFLVLEMLLLDKLFAKMPKVLSAIVSRIYFAFVTVLGMAIFYFEDNTFANLGKLFGVGADGFTDIFTNSVIVGNVFLLAVSLLLAFPVVPKIYAKFREHANIGANADRIIKTVTAVVLIGTATVHMVGNTYSPFLYFRF